MDWYSRYVIDWQLSISLEAEFCIDTIKMALDNSICGIFNTDQGAQYTSNAWINILLNRGISISMEPKVDALIIYLLNVYGEVLNTNVYISKSLNQ